MISSLREAEAIAGSLSKPSKMPGYAYGLPAKECKVGSVLAKLPNTVCSNCYALKGRYSFPAVQGAQYNRLAALAHPQWVEAMVFMIKFRKSKWFRWHDSGDVQSVEHMHLIYEVCRQCPETQFWLPTREKQIVKDSGPAPENLTIRVSGTLIDGPPPANISHTSGVVTSGQTCPSVYQEGKCGDCRDCWSKDVEHVTYLRH